MVDPVSLLHRGVCWFLRNGREFWLTKGGGGLCAKNQQSSPGHHLQCILSATKLVSNREKYKEKEACQRENKPHIRPPSFFFFFFVFIFSVPSRYARF